MEEGRKKEKSEISSNARRQGRARYGVVGGEVWGKGTEVLQFTILPCAVQ